MFMCIGYKGVECDQNICFTHRYFSTRYIYEQKSPSSDYIHVHYLRYTGSFCIRIFKRSVKLKNSLLIHWHKT